MPDFITIDTSKARYISADSDNQVRITLSNNTTLYYDDANTVSSSSNDGNITQGANVVRSVGTWVIPAANAQLIIEPLTGEERTDQLRLTSGTTSTYGITQGDVNLYRSAANVWSTDDGLTIGGAGTITGEAALTAGGTVGGSNPTTAADGLTFGTGSNPATLYRSAADTLKTDDAFTAAGALTASNGATITGAATVSTTLGVTGVTTATGGVAGGTAPKTIWPAGPPPLASTDGTDTAGHTTTVFLTQMFIPVNCTLTGIGIFNGSANTDKYVVALFNSAGTAVANSATAGTASSGTDTFQEIAFTGTYASLGPATYWVGLYTNGTTVRFNSIPAAAPYLLTRQFGLAGSVTGQTFGTVASVTLPTTFTADKGPFSYVY